MQPPTIVQNLDELQPTTVQNLDELQMEAEHPDEMHPEDDYRTLDPSSSPTRSNETETFRR